MIDILIVGAGIIGSWVALELSSRGYQVVVCDSTVNGMDGISGRNSGVLHAGIYYPSDSLKAFHCIRGKQLAEEFAKEHNVDLDICGKLIVADPGMDSDIVQARLEKIYNHAKLNGADGIVLTNQAKKVSHFVKSNLALYSKYTGVIDAAQYLKAVRLKAQNNGAIFLWNREFVHGQAPHYEFKINKRGATDPASEKIDAGVFINAAGLYSAKIANSMGLTDYEIRPNRGEYYRLSKRLPVNILIYPLPSQTSTALGVHYTYQCNGEAYAGPNSIDAKSFQDYEITMGRDEFFESLNKIIDYYKPSDLSPGYSGLRPRLFFKDESIKDFVINNQVKKQVHLLGIESPGLTSAPSIAKTVAEMI